MAKVWALAFASQSGGTGMRHFLATPRAMAVAAVKTGWHQDADALPGARRLLAVSVIVIGVMAITVIAAAVYAVWQIDQSAIRYETARARVALTSVRLETGPSEAAPSEARLASTLSNSYTLGGAHIGDATAVAPDEIALRIPDSDGRLLIWTPRRLGTELFLQLAPIRAATSLVFLLGIVFLMRRLYLLARELERRRVEAQALAVRDALTGLGNRRAFDNGIERMLAEGAGKVALFYLDLDGFKQVNDTLGHGAGDDVLRIVGKRLAALVQPDDLLVRLGGDEFVILRKEHSSADELARHARAIEATLAEPVALGTQTLQIGVSMGIAIAPVDGASGDALLHAADAALYRAKRDRTGFAIAAAA